MSNLTPGPDHAASVSDAPVADVRDVSGSPFTLANAKKAYSAGVAGLVVAVGSAVTAGGVFVDGRIDSGEVASVIGAAVIGFFGGFFAAFAPTNGTKV